MCGNGSKNNKLKFKINCGNCIHSSLEIFKEDMIACDKYKTLEKFDDKKECYE